MKHLKYIAMAFAVALLAASCSQDELPGEGGDTPVTGQTQTYTFTVSPDIVMEGEAGTRTPTATMDDQPTRCFMQVYDAAGVTQVTVPIAGTPSNDNGDYTFTTKLFSNTEYTYLFWADNANVEVADLQAVPYTAGTVAFSYRTKGTPETVAKTTVSLEHAVTKLTLQTTTETSVDAEEAVRVTASCASSYNVAAPAKSTFSSQTAEKVFDVATDIAANKEVASFYFIPRDEEQDVDVEFHLLKQTIENVPLVANIHVYLQGDLSEDNPKWGATSEYAKKQIDRFFKDENGNPKGDDGGDGAYGFYLPSDRISELEAVIGAIFHEKVEIRLDGGYKVFDKTLEGDYYFSIY
ncbi:MAG TPA: hypothetical protein H9986_02045, partial [Candidatus Prevotella stercoripullorum]|nr:hypothetical protein [Candidatus Prevotella stercoripullorum]